MYLGPGHSSIVRGRIAPFVDAVEAHLVTTEAPPRGFLARYPRLRCTLLPRPLLRRLPRRLFAHTADYLIGLPRLVRRWRPDVIHVHYVSQLAALALVPVRGVPLVLTVMGADVLEEQVPRPLMQDLAVRALFRRAAAVTAKSEFLAQRCRQLGTPPGRVHLVPWGVPLQLFRPRSQVEARSRLALPAKTPILLSSRALDPLYNHLELLEAFAALGEEDFPRGRPLLLFSRNAQDPDYARRVEERARQLGVATRFLDPLEQEGMPYLYASADACVSIPASDGLPQTMLEALACGRPVVSLDLEAYSELPFEGDALVRVAHAKGRPQVAALAQGLRAVLTEGERPGLAAAREWIAAHADFRRSVETVRGLYDAVSG
jgi:glycosyltransferase involved in cell wall biosynthesis